MGFFGVAAAVWPRRMKPAFLAVDQEAQTRIIGAWNMACQAMKLGLPMAQNRGRRGTEASLQHKPSLRQGSVRGCDDSIGSRDSEFDCQVRSSHLGADVLAPVLPFSEREEGWLCQSRLINENATTFNREKTFARLSL